MSNCTLPSNRNLGVIQNNDMDNILFASSGKNITSQEYLQAVGHLGTAHVLAHRPEDREQALKLNMGPTQWFYEECGTGQSDFSAWQGIASRQSEKGGVQ